MNNFQKGWLLAALGVFLGLAPAFGIMAVNVTVMTGGLILVIIGMIMFLASVGFFDSRS